MAAHSYDYFVIISISHSNNEKLEIEILKKYISP